MIVESVKCGRCENGLKGKYWKIRISRNQEKSKNISALNAMKK